MVRARYTKVTAWVIGGSLLISLCRIGFSKLGCTAEHLAILVRPTGLTNHGNSVKADATNFSLIRKLILTGICVAIALVRRKVVVIVVNIIAVLIPKRKNGIFVCK
ncbi:MAG: hypothetical protein BYD32DRAFT_408145 [Podila humilis]|nr:MAG: hypothetical protein BYD32DRAFT_408145 [Podila humilis]